MKVNDLLLESEQMVGKTKYAKLLLRRGPEKYAMMELVNHIIQKKPTSLAQIVGGLNQHLGNINRYYVRVALDELIKDRRIKKVDSDYEMYQRT